MDQKDEIQKLLREGSSRISVGIKPVKSNVWRDFEILLVDGVQSPFVMCSKCSKLLKWKSRDGTNGLWSHLEFCSTRSPQQKQTKMDQKNILLKNHMYLMDNIFLGSGLVDLLYQYGVLSPDMYEGIKAEKTTADKISYLLVSVLPRATTGTFDLFIEALKCSQQMHIVKHLLGNESIGLEMDVSQSSQSGFIQGFVHDVRAKCKSKSEDEYLSFHIQVEENKFQPCFSYCPTLHENALKVYADNQCPVHIARIEYVEQKDFCWPQQLVINEKTHIFPIQQSLSFSYKPMPVIYTPLDEISQLGNGEFINVKIQVIGEGSTEYRQVKKRKFGDDDRVLMKTMQEKVIKDERGNSALLTACEEFTALLSPGTSWYDLRDVSVMLFNNTKNLGTNINSILKVNPSS